LPSILLTVRYAVYERYCPIANYFGSQRLSVLTAFLPTPIAALNIKLAAVTKSFVTSAADFF
jgi:hypothetical protein